MPGTIEEPGAFGQEQEGDGGGDDDHIGQGEPGDDQLPVRRSRTGGKFAPAAGGSCQYVGEVLETGRTEQHPGEGDQRKRDNYLRVPVQPGGRQDSGFPVQPAFWLFGEVSGHEVQGIQGAPGKECEAGAVPDAAQEKGHGDGEGINEMIGTHPQVTFFFQTAGDAESEREKDIIAQPVGQRDVPAAPKIFDGGGGIGTVEIFRELESQQFRASPGDIDIS